MANGYARLVSISILSLYAIIGSCSPLGRASIACPIFPHVCLMMSKNPIPVGTTSFALPASASGCAAQFLQIYHANNWLTLPPTLQMVNNHRPRLRCTCVAGGLGLFTERREQHVRICCSWLISARPSSESLNEHTATGLTMVGSTLGEGRGRLWNKCTLESVSRCWKVPAWSRWSSSLSAVILDYDVTIMRCRVMLTL